MTSPDRLDSLAFCGCFAYVDSDVPPGMTLADWRSRRSGSGGFDSSTTSGAPRAGPVLAPHDRTARMRAQRPRGGRGPGSRSDR